MGKFFSRFGIYILAFILPIILMGMVFVLWGVYPFGGQSILMADQFTQYIQFYNHLFNVIFGRGSLLYSWEAGMGLNFWGTFSYYLASPFSFIVLLFERSNLPEAFIILTLIKIGLSGLTMSFYITKMFELNNTTKILFSTQFALISFGVGYYFNIMWLDSIYLLPLVLLGVEKIYRGKYLLFTISLSVLFISNFYMAYIVGVFTFLYFIITSVSNSTFSAKTILSNFVRFIVCTVIAAGISGIITIPTYIQLKSNEYQPFIWSGLLDPTFGFFEFIHKLYNSSTNLLELPNVYSGLLVLLLAPLFFLQTTIKTKEKILYFILLGFLFLSFQIKGLNIVWHAFETPTGYLHRFGFVFSFLLIYLAIRSYMVFNKENLPALVVISFINVCILILLTEITPDLMSTKKALLNILLITIFSFLLYSKIMIKKYHFFFAILLLIFSCIDLSVNAFSHVKTLNSYPGYNTARHQYNPENPAFEQIINEMNNRDNSLFRMNTPIRITPNDSLRFGYKGMSNFNTLSNGTLHEFMNELGYSTTLGARSLMQNNGILSTDALFGFKYMVTDQQINKHGYEKVTCSNGICLYENKNSLPIGYMVDKRQAEFHSEDDNPFEKQNQFLGSSGDTGGYFSQEEPSATSYSNLEVRNEENILYIKKINPNEPGYINMKFNLKGQRQFYTLLDAGKGFAGFNDTKVYVNEQLLGVYPTYHNERVLDLGAYENEIVNIKIEFLVPETQLVKQMFYSLNMESFNERIMDIRSQSLDVSEWKATSVKGEISTDKANTLFLSIPYDKGWTANLDGRSVPIEKVGGFLGIFVEKSGTHRIEVSYLPKGFVIGSIISGISLIVLIVLNILFRRKGASI
jgi:uncharacterized membrane protein YfhO